MKQHTLRALSLSLLFLLTALTLVLIIPTSRQVLFGFLFPLHRSEALTVRSLSIQEDYGNQILSLKLSLKNTSEKEVTPLSGPLALELTTEAGERVSPHILPNAQTPEGLRILESQARWQGEFRWWLEPDQLNQPLRLSWLEEEVLLFEEEGK